MKNSQFTCPEMADLTTKEMTENNGGFLQPIVDVIIFIYFENRGPFNIFGNK